MKLSIAIVLSLLIFSCTQEKANIEGQSDKEFQKVDSLVLEFDEIGSVDLLAIGSYYDENGGAVAILRTTLERRYIDIFDTQSGKLLNKIPIEYDGPDGVGGEISKIVISDPKSVYIFNQWTGFFTQHDTNGKILNKFKINFNENSGRGYLSPGSWLYQNYIIHKNTIYFSGWLPWAHQAKSTEQIGLINLKTKEVATRFSRPEQYETYMWGAGNLYELYMDFHSVTNELILSYPIENDLILLNPQNGKIRRVNAASKHFSEVKPFSQDFEKIDIQGLMDHDKNNKFFIGVIFDPSNNFIYRMTSRPTPESDVNQAKPRLISVIILDKDFNKIDEIDLDLVDLNFNMGFISTKGWYILNRKLTNEKEGQLVFDIYSYR
jgi:hypothetical protein